MAMMADTIAMAAVAAMVVELMAAIHFTNK